MHNGDPLKKHGLMAYMDGELSESDRVAFEEALTLEQRQMMGVDKALQNRLADLLKDIDRCPDRLWDRVQSDISGQSRPGRRWQVFVPIATAACLIVGFGLLYANYALSGPVEYQVSFPANIRQFAGMASTHGDRKAIEQALNENGFAIGIGDIAACNRQHRHRVTLHGMNILEIGKRGYPCAQLRFSCCGQPVSTFVAKESRRITPESFKAPETPRTVSQTVDHVDGYLIVTMSHHPTVAVASLFDTSAEDHPR